MFNLEVPAGSKTIKQLKVLEHPDGSPVEIPVLIAQGAKAGKTLYVGSSFFSSEIVGIEICRRLSDEINTRELTGRVLVLPTPNPIGLRARENFNTYDDYYGRMELVFPGNPDGSPSQILVNHISQIVSHADFVLDLHSSFSGAKCIPYVVVPPETGNGAGTKSLELARVFGGEVILSDSRSVADGTLIIKPKDYNDPIMYRSLLTTCTTRGTPAIQAELGEGDRLDEDYIQYGLRGIRNIMHFLNMTKGNVEPQGKQIECSQRISVRPKHGGLFLLDTKLGQEVSAGQVLARVAPPLSGLREVEELVAPVGGIIIRTLTRGTVVPGDAAISIGVPKPT